MNDFAKGAPARLEVGSKDAEMQPLGVSVRQSVDTYLAQLGDYPANGLYELVLREVERPLLEAVMGHCRDNQTQAAQILGMSRSTLRKKLKLYSLD